MRVVFRADASIDIGAGHVMRCLALADALAARGASCHFMCRELSGHLCDRIETRGFPVTRLPMVNGPAAAAVTAPADDAAEFLAGLSGPADIVIVDHYGLGEAWEQIVRKHCGQLVVIDDLCRSHMANLLVDQTLGRSAAAYSHGQLDGVLAGSEYALLQPTYYRLREQLDRSIVPQEHRLLVSMGGYDSLDVTGSVLAVLETAACDWIDRIDLVLPATAPHFSALRQRIDKLGGRFVLHDFVEDMAALMSHCTLAIGAPGSTTWERAVLGLPSVLVPFAPNQVDVAVAMQDAKAAVSLQRDALPAALPGALAYLRNHWADCVQANLAVTTGLGCRRVVQRILPVLARDGSPVWLAVAGEADISQVYAWQLMPEVRRYARNPRPPDRDEHNTWMRARLRDPFCYFYIVRKADARVGVVRLDRLRRGEYEVSIYLLPEVHGQGLGRIALNLLDELHRELTIHATVLPGNIASFRLFASAGYQGVSDTEFVLPPRI
jgi:UDP-2,4-diacetamido-2,4,6-trideoxy-beta-L-altropyranose hydrolase